MRVSLLALIGAGVLAGVFLIDRRTQATCGCEVGFPVQYLGNKMEDDGQSGHARNVWDLQVYRGRIYLGGGSTVENAGPVNVWAYDPAIGRFVEEFTVSEEAIELYRVFGGELYIPAADPTRGDTNNFYRRSGGAWI